MTKSVRVAMLSPIAWRTPPRHYGPWERVVSLLTEALVDLGVDVTLFATGDSESRAKLVTSCPRGYEEDRSLDAKVWECLHISQVFERSAEFDLIHNHFDFLPLSYCGLVDTPVLTTIHGFSSPRILPVYKKYANRSYYVSISDADRRTDLPYVATIHHGIDIQNFSWREQPGDYLVFFGRIHHDKGTREAIEIAQRVGLPLTIAGIIQDQEYFTRYVEPHLDGQRVRYVGSVGPQQRDALLGQARALLHPINFNEPFGLSVVESMATGTPVIAYRRGSMPELIQDGINGFLADTMQDAVTKVEQVNQIDRRACRRVVEQRFSAERMAKDYLRVYEQVLRIREQEGAS